ncbi:hypothetical protein D3C75_741220 [compost metagenome]
MLLLAGVTQADEPAGAVTAEVVSAKCIAKKEVGISALFGDTIYQCRLWVESEYGQERINLDIDHPVKKGDKFILVQSGDGTHSLL